MGHNAASFARKGHLPILSYIYIYIYICHLGAINGNIYFPNSESL